MAVFTAALRSVSAPASLSHLFAADNNSLVSALTNPPFSYPHSSRNTSIRGPLLLNPKVYVPGSSTKTENVGIEYSAEAGALEDPPDNARKARISSDWKAAKTYIERGQIYEGKIEGSNGGGLLVRFYSLVGFLPFPQLSPSHLCKEPHKTIQEIAETLTGSRISVKVIQAAEEKRKLIFSEKEASWSKFSQKINVGDIFEGRVGSVEDYGAFIHLRFSDGRYHLTGLVHVSEVSWDLVQDVRDILTEGDEVRVKVIKIDRYFQLYLLMNFMFVNIYIKLHMTMVDLGMMVDLLRVSPVMVVEDLDPFQWDLSRHFPLVAQLP
ncbi:hypothetical protein RJ639_022916 [Escallonia herrerae]|uniref:S1 motif domain-containing protein n=1 Tax=Escallonia herrerae TaxID=1293975 RepID=A0AA88UYJ8_9ASTE|nr:hypothetical protein RJ639_022916 [Escallonia herrerae]